jgi:peptidoglycan-associated lipoprotein
MKQQLRKIAAATLILSVVLTTATGCSLFRKKSDTAGTETSDGSIKTETTADGGSEQIDGSPMNFLAQGSDSGTIEGLKTVFFPYDQATLSGSEKEKLDGNVAWMKRNSSTKLTIEGNCDQRGSNEYNLSLGERRANAVKKMMVSEGIAANRLSTVSFGEEKPLVQGDSESAMAKNRRANFVPSN